jgi:hypothetical protein
MSISLNNIRVGKKYYLINDGERHEFVVMAYMGGENFKLKDLLTLEVYDLHDLIRYGKQKDFELWEL